MKKISFFISIAVCLIVPNVYAFAEDFTFSGISKIYIEYENGQNQVLELPQPVNYQYPVNNPMSLNGTESTLLQSGELNQNSKISRIALYMDSMIYNSINYSINGYFACRRVPDIPIGYQTITTWQEGTVTGLYDPEPDYSNFHNGVIDFNGIATYSSNNNGTMTISRGTPFDAKNKSVHLRFKELATFFGGEIQTQDL